MAATSRSALIIYYPIFIGPLLCGLIWGESHPESSWPKVFPRKESSESANKGRPLQDSLDKRADRRFGCKELISNTTQWVNLQFVNSI